MADTEPDPRIVFVAESAHVAEAVVQLLATNDIPAEVAALPSQTNTDPLTGATETAPTEEFPIVVTEQGKLEAARDLLATAHSQAKMRAVREKRANRTGTLTVACEDCGKSSEWPAQLMGTTEMCPHCGGYMDIPDPDEDWSGMDFGDAEDEVEPKE